MQVAPLLTIRALEEALSKDKPGFEIQKEMSPVQGDAERYYETPDFARKAGVMMVLYLKESDWHTAFLKRTMNRNDAHAGQISLPGGRYEEEDSTLLHCALRETEEEIGIPQGDIDVVGSLSSLYVYASNHLVHPFVGFLNNPPEFRIDQSEVHSVIEAPVNYLADHTVVKMTDLSVRGFQLKNVPYYDLFGEVMWGATAMMVSEFLNIWKRIHE